MKTFNHVGAAAELKPLSATQVKGKRFYKTPDGKWYPSVTTIVSHISSATLKAWEERVGFEEAEKVRRTSSLRGTKYHAIVEAYIKKFNAHFQNTIFNIKLRNVLDKILMVFSARS